MLTNFEIIRTFLCTSIFLKNSSLIINNNTRELSDPKFKLELLLDLLHQVNQFMLLFANSLIVLVFGGNATFGDLSC